MCLPDGYAGAAACTVVAPGGAGKYAAESQGVGAAAKKAAGIAASGQRSLRRNYCTPRRCLSPSCSTWEKLTPARSARSLR